MIVLSSLVAVPALAGQAESIGRVVEVAPVWSGHPVGFSLLTHGEEQFIAFYDAERHMTLGSRKLDSDQWHFVRLPEQVGWDSHNSIVMTIDNDGHLHLSGNMHNHPLVYFRTTRPLDIDSMERVPGMIGDELERRCTYPRFFRDAEGRLLFTYRNGSSGDGEQIYNVYDLETRTWRRLLDQPLVSGEGEMNAYFHGPQRGPDGRFHMVWVWRNTFDCATNHSPSYASSPDLIHWENSRGEPLELPITPANSDVVDPVQPGDGIINGNVRIGFDTHKRPVVSYHKFDEDGHTQVYNARLEDGQWIIYQVTDWDYRWEFSGGGSIVFEIRVGGVQVERDGRLSQSYQHVKHGNGTWILDEQTLRPVGTLSRPGLPAELGRVESDFPGMQIRRTWSTGSTPRGVRYLAQWETLGPHRDRPRPEPHPEPTMLRVYELQRESGQ